MIISALLALFVAASPAAAWWEKGHQTTAEVALKLVQPETRKSIDWLLRREKVLETPTCPMRTIEQASVWPDCIKTLGDRFSYQYNWHFQDFDICRPFDFKQACPGGNCATAQIGRAQRMLADRKLPPRDRLMALAFLVHFVGDMHQPLHMSEHDNDQGGNKVKIRWHGEDTNLHSIWDGKVADPAIDTAPAGAAGILSEISPAERADIAKGTLEDWAHEIYDLSKKTVYGTILPQVCKPTPAGAIDLSDATALSYTPTIRNEIARGGIRLARLLDEALNGDHPEVAHPPKPEPVKATTPATGTNP